MPSVPHFGSTKPSAQVLPLEIPAKGVFNTNANVESQFEWVKSKDYLDGTTIEFDGTNFILSHVEYVANRTILAKKSEIVKKTADGASEVIQFVNWKLSSDARFLLLSTNYIKGWRHSYFADYWVYDIKKRVAKPLFESSDDTNKGAADNNLVSNHEKGKGKVALALWSPKGHDVFCIKDNDLYVTKIGQDLSDIKQTRVTHDGSKNIINGISDWVYEEEVLMNNIAMWISPDDSYVAYLKFNDTKVQEIALEYYAKYGQEPYPTKVNLKYPKPGTPNPVVSLHIAFPGDSNNAKLSVSVNFGDVGFAEDDGLIVEVKWLSDNNNLLVRCMNRVQDHQKLFLVTRTDTSLSNEWKATLVRDEKTSDGAWYNMLQSITAVGLESMYLDIIDHEGYAHIALFQHANDASPTRWLTSGNWDIVKISSVDAAEVVVYYISTEEGSTQRHLYSVHLDGSHKQQLTPPKVLERKALVPNLDITVGVDNIGKVGFYSADFSPSQTYYALGYQGPDVPFVSIVKTNDANWIRILQEFSRTRACYEQYSVPPVKYLTIKNDNNDQMNAKLIFPSDFDGSGNKKYPVLMNVYGGPTSQTVDQKFRFDFQNKMALHGFIVLQVDGRGTGFKGRVYRSSVSKNLGFYETKDQITAAKWIASQKYVNASKVGIWGWSYGGYMAAKAIEADSGVFAVGMSVAPVTQWEFYDSVYTERYMKTPQMNPDGYKKSAVQNMKGFEHADYLLVHGTADDNVHFQNSAVLEWKLVGSGVAGSTETKSKTGFRVQYYADSDHSMGENNANSHVYDLLLTFVCDKMNEECKAK